MAQLTTRPRLRRFFRFSARFSVSFPTLRFLQLSGIRARISSSINNATRSDGGDHHMAGFARAEQQRPHHNPVARYQPEFLCTFKSLPYGEI